jgi:hypothetical protein
VGTGGRATGGRDIVRMVDQQCLLLARVHDRIAAIPEA